MKKILLFISLIFVISFAYSQNYNVNDKIPVDTAVIHGVLPNGLTYYIRHNETPKNRAELTLAVHSGSIQEDEDQRGLAHLCEHMAFNGTKNYPKHKLIDFLEKTGMKFGADLNAYTIFDETVYGITVPLDSAQFLDKGLLVLHDWAHYVTYENEEIDAERGVVHEEWRMHQGAQFRMQDKLFQAIFKGSKYADRNTIGLMSVVDSCDYSTLKRYYKDWYRTDREAIIVVGDINPKEVEKKIKEIFGSIPKTENPRKYVQEDIPDNDKPIIAIMSDKENPSSAVQIFIKQPKFYIKTVGDYRTSLTFDLFSKMINDRLTELTHSDNPPYSYGYAGYSDFIGPKDVYIMMAATKEGQTLKGAEALLRENYRVKQYGFTATELERAKKTVLKKAEKLYNDRNKQKSKTFVEEYKANFLLPQKPYPGIYNEYKMTKQFIDGIKLEEVNKLANKWITEKNMVFLIMSPEKDGLKIPTEQDVKDLLAKVKTEKLEAYVDKV
ncbi:MAG: insulinase family protein, partial [Bacteroidetes bacterium]